MAKTSNFFKNLMPKKKPKAGGSFVPNFLRKVRTGSEIADDKINQTNTDLTTFRTGQTAAEIVRNFAKNSPDISHAKETIIRLAITKRFIVYAKSLEDDIIDPEATRVAQSFLARMNKIPTRVDSFSPQSSLNSISETLVSQLITNGTCASELVLDKALLPSHIQPISTNNLKYSSGGDRVVPFIKQDSGNVVLDSLAVCIISLSQDPDTPYADSWFGAVIQSILAATEFTNDLRRAFRKVSLPRVAAEIEVEKFMKSISTEIAFDPKKLKEVMDSTVAAVEEQLNGLAPEDALVHWDMIKINHLNTANASNHENIKTHSNILNGQVSTGVHTLPSVLGRGESQTTASTETVLFLKMVESIQNRINEVYSYLLTLAVRLHGYDVSVTFEYAEPTLRPEEENEAFKAMKQSRIFEQLSYGIISDEEASLKLTGDLPSGNFTSLSGTGFYGKKSETVDNPYSNTSVSGDQLNQTKDQKDRKQGTTKPKTNKTTG